ncbi:hypothetical protein [Salibacterium halotolerans]|uniref:Intracellular proteinase inhibitor n=1 Tax=Salibacterium halotolerans TaxID=1884432 RepID=A0A1I5T701_9BACI|nr:hypothetical protein [Salibacterium halotolerans]SFP78427.1 hypothetical protein SAMN05518683_11024 [Salibacterium halotolerans]
MKRFLAVFLLPVVLFLEACSSTDTSSMEEKTSFSNELYTVTFEHTDRAEKSGSNASISFSIAAKDETRHIDASDITLRFPERLSDTHGNSYQTSGKPEYSQKQEQNHIVTVKQSLSSPLHEVTSHLTVPLLLIVDNSTKNVNFPKVNADSFPLTREELTIIKMERDGKTFHIQAEDHASEGKLDWSMNVQGEKIYPAFTNTEINDNGTYEGSLEFAYQPGEQFSLTVERTNTKTLEWEMPFVIPAS